MVVFVGLDLQSCCLDTIGALKRYNAREREHYVLTWEHYLVFSSVMF